MAPQQELTKTRPANYSVWHRYPTLPKWCYHTDGDWFEQRLCNGQLECVAYIETIELPASYSTKMKFAQYEYELWAHKYQLMKEIHRKMGIRCFVVRHTPDCGYFSVAEINNSGEQKAEVMDEFIYKHFIQGLEPSHPCTNCGNTSWQFYLDDKNECKSGWHCSRCNSTVAQFEFDIPFDEPLNIPFEERAQ